MLIPSRLEINVRKMQVILINCEWEKYPLANVCELESSMCPKHWEDFASGLASLLGEKFYQPNFASDLKLGELPSLFIVHNITISWLYSLNGFWFYLVVHGIEHTQYKVLWEKPFSERPSVEPPPLAHGNNYRMLGHFGPPVLHLSKSFEELSITQ